MSCRYPDCDCEGHHHDCPYDPLPDQSESVRRAHEAWCAAEDRRRAAEQEARAYHEAYKAARDREPAFDDLRAQNEALKALDRDVRMPAVEALRAENERLGKMARDRDDVIHGLAEHLRAALAVIDRYEAEVYRLAFDEGHDDA